MHSATAVLPPSSAGGGGDGGGVDHGGGWRDAALDGAGDGYGGDSGDGAPPQGFHPDDARARGLPDTGYPNRRNQDWHNPPNPRVLKVPRASLPVDMVKFVDKIANYVVRGGALVEDELRDRERHNPYFAFLNAPINDPVRLYYRWRVYSLAQGDSLTRWRTEPFVMVEGDDLVFQPPPMADGDDGDGERNVGAVFAADAAMAAQLHASGLSPDPLPGPVRTEFAAAVRGVIGPDRAAIGTATRLCLANAKHAFDALSILLHPETMRWDHTADALIAAGDFGGGDGGGPDWERLVSRGFTVGGEPDASPDDAPAAGAPTPTQHAAIVACRRMLGRWFLLSDILCNGFAAYTQGVARNVLKAAALLLPGFFDHVAKLVLSAACRLTSADVEPGGVAPPAVAPPSGPLAPHGPLWALVGWLRTLWALWRGRNVLPLDAAQAAEGRHGWLLLWPR